VYPCEDFDAVVRRPLYFRLFEYRWILCSTPQEQKLRNMLRDRLSYSYALWVFI
jgi:hypothetical protein